MFSEERRASGQSPHVGQWRGGSSYDTCFVGDARRGRPRDMGAAGMGVVGADGTVLGADISMGGGGAGPAEPTRGGD